MLAVEAQLSRGGTVSRGSVHRLSRQRQPKWRASRNLRLSLRAESDSVPD